jgi:hypothetical protein
MNTDNGSSTTPPASSQMPPEAGSPEWVRKVISGKIPAPPLRPGDLITPEERKRLGLDTPRTYIRLEGPNRPPQK